MSMKPVLVIWDRDKYNYKLKIVQYKTLKQKSKVQTKKVLIKSCIIGVYFQFLNE